MSASDIDAGGPPGDPDDAALAAEYVLRLLDPEEEAACSARLARDPGFAADVARWRSAFAVLDAEFAEEAPPARVRERAEARLFGRPPSLAERLWGNVALWRGVAAAAVTAAVVAGLLGRPPQPEETRPLVATVAPAAPAADSVQLVALLDSEAGLLRFTRIAGAAPPGSSLELWVMPEGAAAPASLGVVPAEERFNVPVPAGIAVSPGTAILVSLEAEGGSPTGQPQGPVLAQGAISEL
jgi:anti-sigma-K factor RskA